MYRTTRRRGKVLGAVFVLPIGLISTGGTALASAPSAAGSLDSPPAGVFTAHVILGLDAHALVYPSGGDRTNDGTADQPRRHHPPR